MIWLHYGIKMMVVKIFFFSFQISVNELKYLHLLTKSGLRLLSREQIRCASCLDCPVHMPTTILGCCLNTASLAYMEFGLMLQSRWIFNHGENLAITKLVAMKTIYSTTRQNPQNRGTRNLHQIITSREPIRLKSRNTNAITIPI